MWTFRPARIDEAEAACEVLRSSITDLCDADHNNDPAKLGAWLANKTPANVRAWIEANPTGFLVCVGPDGIVGVGSVTAAGAITLNYVAPLARFRGVSKGLIDALEACATAFGATSCTLISTATAHDFYLRCGYVDAGAPVSSYGGMPAIPMQRQMN